MRNLYWITANQAATIALFQVMNRYAGNLPPSRVAKRKQAISRASSLAS
jgi:hypothetical protein